MPITLSLLITLIGIGLVDSLNPSLFVAQFYLLTTPRPVGRILAYIAGVLLVMLVGGVLILGGFRTLLADVLTSIPPQWLLAAQVIGGVLLLVYGWRATTTPAAADDARKPRSASLAASFLLGVVVMFNEITTALPYFIALERIADAELSWGGNLLALVIYNGVFALPLFAFLAAYIRFQQRFVNQIETIKAWLARWLPVLFKYGALLLGIVLLVDAGTKLL